MPPSLALLVTLAFIAFLFRRDLREGANVSSALWLPLLWMLIIGSRFVSQWLSLFGLSMGAVTQEEGSPVDAIVFFALIVGGLLVLNRRQVRVSEIVRNNGWLTVFFLYCLVSILWSDFPFVAFKRWIKILGHPIMVLILFTEPDPEEAVTRLLKRAAYVLIPVSILFIKYYPQYGRGFDEWTGAPVNTGITTNKNELGLDCLILGFFFFWYLLKTLQSEGIKRRRYEVMLSVGFLFMIWWVLSMAHSSTSLVSLLVGMLVMVLLGRRWVNRRFIGSYALAGILACVVAELLFGVSAQVIQLLGKDPTLTDRTIVWQDVLALSPNPILGAGFESFWLGERLEKLWAKWWWHPNQAHNGYIEVYVNLGLVGLFILCGLIIATFMKARLALLRSFEFGRFRLGFLAAVVVYNWTEASFKALHPVWFVFYIIAVDYPRAKSYSCDGVPEGAAKLKEADSVYGQA
jgi:exopolysaccharide production protein ExoQ